MHYFLFILLSLLLPLSGENWEKALPFGNAKSHNQVYLFTDWLCPICKNLEPKLEPLLPKLFERAQVTFAVFADHEGSATYVAFDLSFMLHNKAQYLKIRPLLNDLAMKTNHPTAQQLEAVIAPLHIHYEPLSAETIQSITKYFFELVAKYNVIGTPTMVLTNTKTGKMEKLVGQNINETNVLQTLDAIEK